MTLKIRLESILIKKEPYLGSNKNFSNNPLNKTPAKAMLTAEPIDFKKVFPSNKDIIVIKAKTARNKAKYIIFMLHLFL